MEATAFAVQAGVDANCGTTIGNNAQAAIEAGLLSWDDVDKILVRLFTARMKTGEFDPDGGPFGEIEDDIVKRTYQQLAEDSSDQAVVLLKNDGILPLGTTGTINSLVLVGDRADELELGDYSTYSPYGTSTALQGIQAAYERYCEARNITGSFQYISGATSTSSGKNYLMNSANFRICDADGNVLRTIDLSSGNANACAVETGNNPVNIGNAKPGADNWVKFSSVDFTGAKQIKIDLAGAYNAAPTTVQIRLGSPTGTLMCEVQGPGDTGGWSAYQTCTVNYNEGGFDNVQQDVYIVVKETPSDSGFTEDEKTAIRNADAVVFFAGTKQGENGYFENTDGYNLNLPNNQSNLIEVVAGLNPNTVVYIQAVSQINVEDFKDKVKGIFWSTYNGQAQGNAAGRLLFGERNPSAKLPFSWYTDINQLANVQDYQLQADTTNNGRTYWYFTGEVTYPFGYGLSYSTFEYSNLTISKTSVTPDDTITVTFDVKNTSGVDGQEVAELYVVSPNAAENDRPVKRLKGFDKQEIQAGQTVRFSIELPVSDLWFWDDENDVQTYDQGVYTIQVGPDSANTPLTANFTLTGQLSKVLNVVTAAPSGHMLDTAAPDKTITTDLSACYNDQTFVDLSQATVTYTSSKPNVASVDQNGVVTAVAGGVATITASVTVNGVKVTDSYPVVVSESIAADSITLDGRPLGGFDAGKTEYSVQVGSFDALPTVAATAAEGVTVSVQQATKANPVATVTLTKGEVKVIYTITFHQALQSFDFTAATEEDLRSTWGIIRENSSNWTLGSDGLTITSEYGDLYMNYTNHAKNMFYQEAPGDWEVETHVVLDQLPTKNYEQFAIIAYQDDDNYLKLGYQGNNSGKKAVEINVEKGGSFQDTAPYSQRLDATELWLRLKKEGNDYTGSYSTDGVNFTELGTQNWPLSNVKIVLTANNGTGTTSECIKATFKTFTVLSTSETVDFKNLTADAEGWSVFKPTAGGTTYGTEGWIIHTTNQDGCASVENQLQRDQTLTGDWTAETHFTISRALTANWEQFGMFFVASNGADCVRINEEHGSGGTNIQIVAMQGSSTIHNSPVVNVDGNTDIYFRMKKTGNVFEMYYSLDGETWLYLGSETTDGRFETGALRLYATSQRSGNASYDATVEYCRIVEGGSQEEYAITVVDNGVCDVTYTVNPQGKLSSTVPNGGTVTFTVTPKAGKVISAKTIAVTGASGQVGVTGGTNGAWTVTVPNIKGDITLTVTEAFGASGITVDGRAVKGFDPETYTYTVNVTELPGTITATVGDGLSYTVEPATEENPVAKVTVSKGEQTVTYTLNLEITPETTQAANPYLPLWEHIPDGEPHVFEDPDNPGKYRVYIYGSHDSSRTGYCGPEYVTWSAPVDDLSQWRYEGVIYSCADNGAGSSTLFAPDVAYKDGVYYLYVHDWGHSQTIRVATSTRPDGPFTYAEGHDNAVMQNPGGSRVDFDPAVFVDDDGRAYAYWGASSRVTGFGSGELEADMKTIKEGTYTASNIDMDFSSSVGTKEGDFDFFEAASVRKVDGAYVLIYSQKVPLGTDDGVVNGDYRGRLAYAYSDSPLGPWTYGGVIIDNGGEIVVPGSELSYDDGNNHGSIVEIDGQWYVFYHRMTQNNETARQGMMEPIEITVTTDTDGHKVVSIPQVEMTSQGANTEGLDAYRQQDAGLACYLTGGAYITSGYRENSDYNPITNIKNGVVAGYKYLNFGTGAPEGKTLKLTLELKSKGEAGTIAVYIDKPNDTEGTLIGVLPVAAGAGDYQNVEATLSNVTGKHALYLVFKSSGTGEICEINKLQFSTDGEIGAINGITLDKTSLTLEPEAAEQLHAAILPDTAAVTVTWTSSNENVATVDQTGLVTAVSTGLATITAEAGGKSAACAVKVRPNGLQSFEFTEAGGKDDVLVIWDVIRENADKWTVNQNGLTITTQYGDLWSYVNNAANMFYQEATGDWTVEAAVELDQVPSKNYQQAAILVYQDDGNYLKVGYQGFTNKTPKVEINSEVGGSFGSATASVAYSGTKIWFRLQKEGNTYTAWYSADGDSFTELGTKEMNLTDIKIVLTGNNGTGVNDPIQVTYKYFHVLSNADKAALKTLYNANKDKLNDNYTDKSWNEFQTALAAAKAVLDDPNAAQTDVDNAKTQLENAVKGLTVKGDKTELEILYNANKDKPNDGYTDTSWSAFRTALTAAKAVLDDPEATQTEVENAKEALQSALNGLTPCLHEHTEYRDASMPTLLKPGYSGDLYCLDCGALLEKGRVIPATGTLVSGGGSSFVESDGVVLPFTDVKPGDWFYSDVQFVYGNDLMNGTGATAFSPNLTLTRGMIVTILYRMEGEPMTRYNGRFSDVANYQWYTGAVEWAAKEEIVTGYPDGRFDPNAPVTREQMAAILYRYAEYKGMSLGDSAALSSFTDSAQVSGWAAASVRWAVGSGLINGKSGGVLDPKGTATRAEAAAMLTRFCGKIG